ncbi:TIR domain-containing protein [Ktedonobacter sp. SOSP1-85]|uniref:TIR domain-containing protein n=1 Tax=Ktedonobacter sp. SOSP1-85 TaxID=2778367 RepID=UPI0035B09E4D
MEPGMNWESETNTQINTVDITLLLISPDFIASNYCYSVKIQKSLERQKHSRATILPIILRPA